MFEVNCSFLQEDTDDRQLQLNELVNSLIGELEEDFSREVLKTKIEVTLGEESQEMCFNELLFSLMMIPVRLWSDEVLEAAKLPISFETSFIRDVTSVNSSIKDYLDTTIEVFSNVVDISEITIKIQYVLEQNAARAWHFNLIKGNSVNIIDLLKAAIVDSEVLDILNFTSEESAQFSEIEDSVEVQSKRLIEILKSDKHDTSIKNMLSSVSLKQFQQAFVNISLKPDLYGKVIEKPINTSFLRGMRNSTDYFINATGARKALITNSDQVRAAGYLSRKLALLVIGLQLEADTTCDGSVLLPMYVTDAAHAKRLTHRYYKLDESANKFKLTTNAASTKPLIGKTIYLASPYTCQLPGNKICARCYGTMTRFNKFHVALASMLTLSEQIIQMLLSSKHLLQVIADHIELPEELQDYFTVDKNSVTATKPCKIVISEYEQDPLSDQLIATALTLIDEEADITAEIIPTDISLAISSISSRLGEDMTVVTKTGEEVFRLTVENNELSAPLKKLLRLIESSVELNSKGGPSEVINEIISLLVSSNIRMSSVGVEMMVRELGRDPADVQRRAPSLDNVDFVRLTKAIVNSNSASVSLVFQEYNKLLDGGLFTKTESALTDYMF